MATSSDSRGCLPWIALVIGVISIFYIVRGCADLTRSDDDFGLREPVARAERPISPKKKSVRLSVFKDVEALKGKLEKVGVGKLRTWRYDGMGWMSATDFYNIGPTGTSGLANNLAIYLESESEDYVRTVKLNLNDYDNLGYPVMPAKAKRLFQAIGLPVPDGLLAALRRGEDFSYLGDHYKVETRLTNNSKGGYYRLIITSN
ncbi:hypothetical protein [Larkinella soli]|uniref:hypothetical protein n=1 Tax=Larkinella soli TaxID=1770527 RepID=UPI000FFBD46B|nr:hypothetical protein [Larkinella soli]